MIQERDQAFLKSAFLIVLFYVVVEHLSVVKSIVLGCYNVVSPLIYGVVIAFVMNLIVVRLEKHMTKGIFSNLAIRRAASIIISVLVVAGIIAIICFSVIPGIVDSVKQIVLRIPYNIDTAAVFLEKNLGISRDIMETVQDIRLDEQLVDDMFGLMENQSVMEAIKASGNVVGSVLSVFARFFIGLFFAFYILAKKESIGAWLHRFLETYLPERVFYEVENIGHIIYETYANFISGQCLDAVILGGLVAFCMGIMGLSYPVLIGVIVAVTALIPVVGAFFGGTVGAVLLVMESPVKALAFLVLFLVLQQIDNRLIYLYVVGNAIGIPSILIFAAIIIGGKFNGVVGMFLGIPFTAVLYTLVEQDMLRRRRTRKETERGMGV